MQIEINSEHINKMVVDAILKSALGEKIDKSVQEAIKDLFDGYKNPVKQLISEHVQRHIHILLNSPENVEKFKLAINKHLTNDFLIRLIDKSIEQASEYMRTNDRY